MWFRKQLLLLPSVRPLGERLGTEFFRTVPERPGVYLMCGSSEGVLYVGKAKNLRQRLGQYRSARSESLPRKLCRLLLRVERIHWDECVDEMAALARERELLRTLRPPFNTVGVYPSPALRVGWEITSDALTLGLGKGTDGLPSVSDPLRQIRSVYAAVIRLIWGTCHQNAPLSSMPAQLVQARTLDRWRESLREASPRFAELSPLLTAFFAGQSDDLVSWLLDQRVSDSKFELAWQTQDAELLREFFVRRSVANEQ